MSKDFTPPREERYECPNGHPFPSLFAVECPDCEGQVVVEPSSVGMRYHEMLTELWGAAAEGGTERMPTPESAARLENALKQAERFIVP